MNQTIRDPDLVTLSEGAGQLGILRGQLFSRLQRGTLPVRPKIIARTTTLYSLTELKDWWATVTGGDVS
jgi:hypothetical protein